MPIPQAILFDFDETMADTLPGRTTALQHACHAVLGLEITPADVLAIFHGSSNLESQVASMSGGDAPTIARLLNTYRDDYYSPDRPVLPFYAGVADTLARLQQAGVRLAMVTSRYRIGPNGNPNHGVTRELERMGHQATFEVVVGYEDTVDHKPSPTPFLHCLRLLSIAAESCIAIGDAATDIVGARAAGIPTGAALWGTSNRASLLAAGPDHSFEHPLDLLSVALSPSRW